MSTGVELDKQTVPHSWLRRVVSEPDTALRQAEWWLADPEVGAELRSFARQLAALACVERGQLDRAREHAHAGLRIAQRVGLGRQQARLRLVLAWTALEQGAAAECEEHLAVAERDMSTEDLGRVACLRGLLRVQSDRYAEAVRHLDAAVRRLRASGDQHWCANALLGRGLARLYLNDLESAESDLAGAERLFAEAGRRARAAACRHNRGCVALRAGDLSGALRLFSDAVAAGLDTAAHPETLVDRADALVAAGMNVEAAEQMREAVVLLERCGRWSRVAETRLSLAECALRGGDLPTAEEEAERARTLFQQQHRPGWAALAAATGWRARIARGVCSYRSLVAARKAAAACADHGWLPAAAELWLAAGRAAWGAGIPSLARKLLRLAASCRHDPAATAAQQVVGWMAEALLAEQDGDQRALFDACEQGIRVVDGHACALAAFELRVNAFGVAAEIADIAVGAALTTGDARLVVQWTERYRAGALQRRPVRPPSDRRLSGSLRALRGAVARVRDSAPHGVRSAMSDVAELERQVRHRALLVEGDAGGVRGPLEISSLVGELGTALLLNYFVHNGHLWVVVVADGVFRLHGLGELHGVESEVERLADLLARKARTGSERARDALADAARRVAEGLGRCLLGPVRSVLGSARQIVVVPTGGLHGMPWAELPGLRGRGVAVAPSLQRWLEAASDSRRPPGRGAAVWVAGPGLDHARREVRSLHAESGGLLLVDESATAERLLSMMDGARVVHIAAHGRFRDDQPMLSCVELADGPLYAYDLDRLRRAPRTVVLSACEVGRSGVSRGDELTGLAAALLGRGTSTLIASVIPVPDQQTADVMLTMHAALREGVPTAQALAQAQAEHGQSGFVCLGYGGGDPR